jgi:hypothetical protein
MSFEIIPVWKKVDAALKQELKDFWQRHNALKDGAQADMRAEQAVCVGRNADGAICAVGTAVVQVLPRLRQPVYYYRQFFEPAQRGQRQTVPFVKRVCEVLQEWNAGQPAPEAIGVLAELQSKLLAEHYSPRGCPMFVSYFEGAMLKPPAPVRRVRQPGAAVRAAQH